MEKKIAGPGYFVGILEVTRKSKPDRHGKLRKVKINIYSGLYIYVYKYLHIKIVVTIFNDVFSITIV